MRLVSLVLTFMPSSVWSSLRQKMRRLVSPHSLDLLASGYLGSTELCSLGDVHVTLNGDLNIREMRLGGTNTHFVQSMVACKGKPATSCWDKATGCNLNSTRCPCEFHMARLPPLDFEYNYIAKRVLRENSPGSQAQKVVVIGLGGGMLPQFFLEHSDPDLTVDAVELNANVVSAARAFFGVEEAESSGRLRVIQGDGNKVLQNTKPESYSTAVVDCFGQGRVPSGCRSSAFVSSLYTTLRPGGEVVQNVATGNMDHPEQDKDVKQELEGLMDLYRSTFGQENVELKAQMMHTDNAVIHAWKSA